MLRARAPVVAENRGDGARAIRHASIGVMKRAHDVQRYDNETVRCDRSFSE